MEFLEHTHTNKKPRGGRMLLSRAVSHKQGNEHNVIITDLSPEEANHGFYSSLFLVPKKNRGHEASDKLEEPQRVCGPTTCWKTWDTLFEKTFDNAITGNRISNWDDGRLQFNGAMIAGSEAEKASPGVRDQEATPTTREVSRLLGKFNSVTRAVPSSSCFAEQYRETWQEE